MPPIFEPLAKRYGTHLEPGGDNWASIGAYDWLLRNASLVTRIDDISGEHGRNIGHSKSHGRGRDIDEFHVYTFPNGAGSGRANYLRLAENVTAALAGDPAAVGRVQDWISQTRVRFAALHALGDDLKIGYAVGSRFSHPVSPGRTITLAPGWAASLLEYGAVIALTEEQWETGLGTWSYANNRQRMFYDSVHNSHFHVQLNERRILPGCKRSGC